jgi:hypothetical protein
VLPGEKQPVTIENLDAAEAIECGGKTYLVLIRTSGSRSYVGRVRSGSPGERHLKVTSYTTRFLSDLFVFITSICLFDFAQYSDAWRIAVSFAVDGLRSSAEIVNVSGPRGKTLLVFVLNPHPLPESAIRTSATPVDTAVIDL